VTEERRGLLYVAAAALVWSTGGLGIKAVDAPPLAVACLRSAVAAVALGAVLRPRLWTLRPGFLVAVVAYAATVTTFVVATKWTTAANAIFLQYSGVVWVFLTSPVVLGEPLRWRDAAAIAVALAGMALFFVGSLDARARTGDLVALASGVAYAATALSLRRERGAPAEAAVTYGNALTAVGLAPAALPGLALSPASAATLVYLGAVQIGAGYVLFLRGLSRVTATQASIVGMLEPIANPVWVVLLLGERPSVSAAVGAVVVLAAVAWRTVGGPGAAETAPPSD